MDSDFLKVVVIVCLVAGAIIVFNVRLIVKNRKNAVLKKEYFRNGIEARGALMGGILRHAGGLPIGRDAECFVYVTADGLQIESDFQQFSIARNKIIGVDTVEMYDTERYLYNGSKGLAISDMLVFRRYLAFTYQTDQTTNTVAFNINRFQSKIARRFINAFDAVPATVHNIDL